MGKFSLVSAYTEETGDWNVSSEYRYIQPTTSALGWAAPLLGFQIFLLMGLVQGSDVLIGILLFGYVGMVFFGFCVTVITGLQLSYMPTVKFFLNFIFGLVFSLPQLVFFYIAWLFRNA